MGNSTSVVSYERRSDGFYVGTIQYGDTPTLGPSYRVRKGKTMPPIYYSSEDGKYYFIEKASVGLMTPKDVEFLRQTIYYYDTVESAGALPLESDVLALSIPDTWCAPIDPCLPDVQCCGVSTPSIQYSAASAPVPPPAAKDTAAIALPTDPFPIPLPSRPDAFLRPPPPPAPEPPAQPAAPVPADPLLPVPSTPDASVPAPDSSQDQVVAPAPAPVPTPSPSKSAVASLRSLSTRQNALALAGTVAVLALSVALAWMEKMVRKRRGARKA